jgi:hypothetical protein
MQGIQVIYKTRHLKYDTNYRQYENRSYVLSEFSDKVWSENLQGIQGCNIQMVHWSNAHEVPWGEVSQNRLTMNGLQSIMHNCIIC